MTDLLPTAQHARIYNDVQSGGPRTPAPGRRGPRWVTVARLLAIALLLGVPLAYFALRQPAVYEGPVRWGSAHSTITLVDRGVTLSVQDTTQITVGGQRLNATDLESGSYPEVIARATVTYWPSVDSRWGGRSVAYAKSIVIE